MTLGFGVVEMSEPGRTGVVQSEIIQERVRLAAVVALANVINLSVGTPGAIVCFKAQKRICTAAQTS
jgi:hypothetical protein